MFPLGLGVMGAAAATALSQVAAAGVYGVFLNKRHMLGGKPTTTTLESTATTTATHPTSGRSTMTLLLPLLLPPPWSLWPDKD